MHSLESNRIESILEPVYQLWSRVKLTGVLAKVQHFFANKVDCGLNSLLRVNSVTSFPINVGVSVCCVLGAKWVAKAYFDRRDNLKTRVTVLFRIKSLVEQWEQACWEELEHTHMEGKPIDEEKREDQCTLRLGKAYVSLFEGCESGSATREQEQASVPFFGIMHTFSFSPNLDLRELLAWCITGYASLSLPTDVAWVDRLSCIARYVVLRRLSAMEEARYYAALHRRVHFGHPQQPNALGVFGHRTAFPFLRSFAIFGHPSWLVVIPSHSRQPFLSLPLSYFPVEAIFTFHATDEQTGWFPLVESLQPRWRNGCEHSLSCAFAHGSNPTKVQLMHCKESFLFLRYTDTLFRMQKELTHRMQEAFYQDKMYAGVAAYEGYGLDCAMFTSPSTVPGLKKRARSAAKELKFKQALGLLYAAELFYAFTKVLLPSWRTMVTPLLLAAMVGRRGAQDGGDGGGGAAAAVALDEATRMRPLRDLALYVVSLSVSNIIRTVLRTQLSGVERLVTGVLDEEIVSAIQSNLLRGDEAFVSRYVESEEGVDRVSSDRHSESVRGLLQPRGSALLHSFKMRAQFFNNVVACTAVALWRNELRLLCFSLCFQRTTEVLLGWFYERLGFSYPEAVHDIFEELESAKLPDRDPHGLALLLDVVAEREATTGTACQPAAEQLRWPFLSLIVTSAVWVHPAPEDDQRIASLSWREALYRCVATMRVGLLLPPGAPSSTVSRLRGLQLDAACVWAYAIRYPYAYHFQYHRVTQTAEHRKGSEYHALLDPYERSLFERGKVATRLPHHLDAYAVMSRPFRFITRQLGIEVIAAQHAVFLLGTQRENSTMGNFFVRNAQSFYGIYAICSNSIKFLSSFLFVVTVCVQEDESSGYALAPLAVEDCLKLKSHMDLYTAMLSGRQFPTSLVQIQQLVQHVPCWIVDDSERSTALKTCAKQWRDHLIMSHDTLQFDPSTNLIVGGLALGDAIRFRNVFFTYPQLHHYSALLQDSATSDGSNTHPDDGGAGRFGLKPILSSVHFTLPCRGASSIIGDTGSGKSSIFKVLRRMYDPLVPIEVTPSLEKSSSWWFSDDVLVEILRLQLVTCPASFPLQQAREDITVHASDVALRVQDRTCITLDHIPICCFSPAYVRKWLAYLDQQTPVFRQLSFYANVQYLNPFVTADDIEAAVGVTNCAEFIQKRPLGLNAPCGDLSGGERQRLALARCLAGISGRVQYERERGCLFYRVNAGRSTSVVEGALLLDEPTSRLDAFNELQITSALEKVMTARGSDDDSDRNDDAFREVSAGAVPLMLVIISHRLSTLHFSRWMIVLREGKVEIEGDPEAVFKNNHFARTVKHIQSA